MKTMSGSRMLKWLLYLLLLFLFQEVVLRICYPVPEIRNLDRIAYVAPDNAAHPFTRNTTRIWESQPDTAAQFVHEMNAYGFRDDNWTIAKPEGKQRVMFLGDSFVEGVMAAQEFTIPEGFARKKGEDVVEVMNAGILGKGLGAYLQAASDLFSIFKPDVAFLCLYANDMGASPPPVPEFYLEPEYYPWYEPRFYTVVQEARLRGALNPIWSSPKMSYLPSLEVQANPFRGREAELARHVASELAEHMKNGTFNPFCVDALAQFHYYLARRPNLGETLPYFRYICQENEVEPVVVYLPSRHQVSNAYLPYELQACQVNCSDSLDLTSEPYQLHQKVIASQCQELGLEFLDMTPWLRGEEARGRRLYWNYDEHMKGFAYLELGEEIAKRWKKGK